MSPEMNPLSLGDKKSTKIFYKVELNTGNGQSSMDKVHLIRLYFSNLESNVHDIIESTLKYGKIREIREKHKS